MLFDLNYLQVTTNLLLVILGGGNYMAIRANKDPQLSCGL